MALQIKPPCPSPRCCRQPVPLARRIPSAIIGRMPSPFTSVAFRHSRAGRERCLSGLRASSAASAASVADHVPQSAPESSSGSPLSAPLRAWHSFWSLGRPAKRQEDKNPRKLSKIVSKLWNIMDVNSYLLTAALFCMVSFRHESLTITIYPLSSLGSSNSRLLACSKE